MTKIRLPKIISLKLGSHTVPEKMHSIKARLIVDLVIHERNKVTRLLGFESLGPKMWGDELQKMEYKMMGVEMLKEVRPTMEELTHFPEVLPDTHDSKSFLIADPD